jgi:hypothetical protein
MRDSSAADVQLRGALAAPACASKAEALMTLLQQSHRMPLPVEPPVLSTTVPLSRRRPCSV